MKMTDKMSGAVQGSGFLVTRHSNTVLLIFVVAAVLEKMYNRVELVAAI